MELKISFIVFFLYPLKYPDIQAPLIVCGSDIILSNIRNKCECTIQNQQPTTFRTLFLEISEEWTISIIKLLF